MDMRNLKKIKIFSNYLILLICIVGFHGGAITTFILPILQIYLSWYNYHCSNKWKTVLILEIHLLISTVLGLCLEGYLYLKYISDDVESHLVFDVILIIGIILVLGLGIITTLAKYFSTKNRTKKDFI